ncbi:HNH endonuclease signature motif containing protein [Ruania rhizosphaerae]|uniref:HNH endonuclease signature motif containing protein n=1 Tax=Ruania rhizosphaerae TaxID=1840413 RepID=UPI001357B05A|nr:HNH endonuclease signature motif containing protein [Ruania rhizosphaerae]
MSSTTHMGTNPADTVREALGQHLTDGDAPGQLAVVSALLDDVLAIDLRQVPSAVLPDVVSELEQTRRRLDALTTATMSSVEADGTWAVSGARTMASWWSNATSTHGGKARSQVHLSRTLRDHLPATETALAAGVISSDHAAALARHATTTDALRERLADAEVGEQFLLEQARVLDADSFTRLVKTWAIRADPDAADRNWREDSGKEHFFVSATTAGRRLDGWLDHTNGQIVEQAFAAVTGVPSADDDRTPSQRNAHALVTMARYVLDTGEFQPSARVRPHLLVHVPADTLHRLTTTPVPVPDHHRPRCTCHHHTGAGGATHAGAADSTGGCEPVEPGPRGTAPALPGLGDTTGHAPGCPADPTAPVISSTIDPQHLTGAEPATLADGTPISHTALAHLTCDAEFTRVILHPDGQILDVGRAQRLHTAAQTRAIWARDQSCQHPGCTAPPGIGEIHHSIWWSRGGHTNTHHGILLCWYHHRLVHQRDITITRHQNHWHFTKQGGRPITYHHPPPCERPAISPELSDPPDRPAISRE